MSSPVRSPHSSTSASIPRGRLDRPVPCNCGFSRINGRPFCVGLHRVRFGMRVFETPVLCTRRSSLRGARTGGSLLHRLSSEVIAWCWKTEARGLRLSFPSTRAAGATLPGRSRIRPAWSWNSTGRSIFRERLPGCRFDLPFRGGCCWRSKARASISCRPTIWKAIRLRSRFRWRAPTAPMPTSRPHWFDQ